MAAKLSNPRDLLLALLADLLYVERRLVGEVLPAVIRAVADEELRSMLAAHLDETRAHVERAETAFRRVDAAPSANLSGGFEGLVAQHDQVAPLVVLPALADVFHAASALRVEHHEIAGYTTTTARRASSRTRGRGRAARGVARRRDA